MNTSESLPSRTSSPALDQVLGKQFPVLDEGFVRVVDYMGADESIVQAARVSYGRGTKRLHEDSGLIKYLLRHSHTTPFEMCEIKLHVRVPMDCWRQWIRHRTANVNEYSTRYSIAIDITQKTSPVDWRRQGTGNRQGSAESIDEAQGHILSEKERQLLKHARDVYEERLAAGVAREQARKDLPLSTYTEAYWKIDLHNLFHFLRLRLATNAQFEIRSYARVIAKDIVAKWCPIAWEAFREYQLDSIHLTSPELAILKAIIANNPEGATHIAISRGWLSREGAPDRRISERIEAEEKFLSLGISPPWLPVS